MSGKRVLSSKGSGQTTMKFHQVVVYGLFGIAAGLVGGLLGLGGGFIMGPLFLELGIPPQVHSFPTPVLMSAQIMHWHWNTSISDSMIGFKCYSYLCNDVLIFHVGCRILPLEPVSSALWYGLFLLTFMQFFSSNSDRHIWLDSMAFSSAVYFIVVAFVAAIIGQHVVRKLINWLGRASLIIFILAFMIFVSAVSLGTIFYAWLELIKIPLSEPSYLNNPLFNLQVGLASLTWFTRLSDMSTWGLRTFASTMRKKQGSWRCELCGVQFSASRSGIIQG